MAKTMAGGGMKWVWMAVGVVTTVLFFWWISVAAEPSQVVVTADEGDGTEASAPGAPAGETVPLGDLTANAANWLGQTVRVPSVQVNSVLNDNAFWVEGPSGPFLVVKADDFAAVDGAAIQTGAVLDITGTFWEQNDQTVDQWEASGFMTDGGHLAQARFATHYLQAREIAPAPVADATTGQ